MMSSGDNDVYQREEWAVCRLLDDTLRELLVRLKAAEKIIEMALYSGSYEGDMLALMYREAEEWLNDR